MLLYIVIVRTVIARTVIMAVQEDRSLKWFSLAGLLLPAIVKAKDFLIVGIVMAAPSSHWGYNFEHHYKSEGDS